MSLSDDAKLDIWNSIYGDLKPYVERAAWKDSHKAAMVLISVEDLTQELWVHVWNNIESFEQYVVTDQPDFIGADLRRASYRHIERERTKHWSTWVPYGREQVEALLEKFAGGHSVSPNDPERLRVQIAHVDAAFTTDDTEELLDLKRAIAKLTEIERRAILIRTLYSMTWDEAAFHLDSTGGALRAAYLRGIRHLTELMTGPTVAREKVA